MGTATYLDVSMYLCCCGGMNADCRTDWEKKMYIEKTVIAFLEALLYRRSMVEINIYLNI